MKPKGPLMNSIGFGWESLLHTDAPASCSLKAALFTTYDRADDRLLAEHVLPLYLKLNREPDGEGTERQYFLLELDYRLKQLHDKIVVVSSMTREEPADPDEREGGTYGWIWRSIRHLTVGSDRKAVQHAKLWMLHWGAVDESGVEYLEIVVTSANLTGSAFKGQIQAAWRVCIELHPQQSETRLHHWGILPDFLRALAKSTREETRIEPFTALLARGECPDGITFIASVPGTHSRQVLRRTPWGAAGLRKIMPPGRGTVNITILSPFVGSWNVKDLARWCAMFEGSPKRLKVVWIDKDHPWARDKKWLLPATTLKSLTKAGSTLLHLRYEPNNEENADLFHEDHRSADARWSHAKVYALHRGNSQRLIVTSTNFSTSAWGKENPDGQLIVENFELGVCIEQTNWRLFDELDEFEKLSTAATIAKLPSRSSTLILWAQAVWDGRNVIIECRCTANHKVKGYLDCSGKNGPITRWKTSTDGLQRSTIRWSDVKRPPSSVQLTCGQEAVSIPVFDGRPLSKDRIDIVPPELDENVVQMLRDELLFEQYGGRIVTEDDRDPESSRSDSTESGLSDVSSYNNINEIIEQGEVGYSDSYAVPAFELARDRLRVVDNWTDRVKSAAKYKTSALERQMLRRDGELLVEAFKRQARRDKKKGAERAIGAELAAQELYLHLKYFQES